MTVLRGDLAALLHSTRCLLLDFDGPVCNIFAGYPAREIAAKLTDLAASEGHEIPPELQPESDPLAVLRWAGTLDSPGDLVTRLDQLLRAAEIEAAASAAPTFGADDVIAALTAHGIPVAIVSNNSNPAIELYLRRAALADKVMVVVGRVLGKPQYMKPSPAPLIAALKAANVSAAQATFLGDSVTDIQAGHAAGVGVIALANKAAKLQRFLSSTAEVVITEMPDFAALIEATQLSTGATNPH